MKKSIFVFLILIVVGLLFPMYSSIPIIPIVKADAGDYFWTPVFTSGASHSRAAWSNSTKYNWINPSGNLVIATYDGGTYNHYCDVKQITGVITNETFMIECYFNLPGSLEGYNVRTWGFIDADGSGFGVGLSSEDPVDKDIVWVSRGEGSGTHQNLGNMGEKLLAHTWHFRRFRTEPFNATHITLYWEKFLATWEIVASRIIPQVVLPVRGFYEKYASSPVGLEISSSDYTQYIGTPLSEIPIDNVHLTIEGKDLGGGGGSDLYYALSSGGSGTGTLFFAEYLEDFWENKTINVFSFLDSLEKVNNCSLTVVTSHYMEISYAELQVTINETFYHLPVEAYIEGSRQWDESGVDPWLDVPSDPHRITSVDDADSEIHSFFFFEDWVSDQNTSTSIDSDVEIISGAGDGAGNWVFTNWKYYEFSVLLGATGISNVTMNFTIPTSFEPVNCEFFSDGSDWSYSSNMSYDSRYGEPVLLRAGTWTEQGGTTSVTFLIWFEDHCLDVWLLADSIPVDITFDGGSYYRKSNGFFRIYSKGGFSLNTGSFDSTYAWILPGGTPFSFHVEDDGGFDDQWMYNEVWFRDVQHLKLLPEIHFLTGYDSFDIQYGVDYVVDGTWETGWFVDINPQTVHYNGLYGAAVWINMSVWFGDRDGSLFSENLYMYNHGSITGVGKPGFWELWVDLWISDKNASSVGAGRVNAYEHAMEDTADLWLRWLNNNWAPMDDIYKEIQGEVPLLAEDDSTIISSEQPIMWRFWSQVKVYSAGGGQVIEVKNFDIFDDTRSQTLPLTGISTPVFDETAVPVVGQRGLLGGLFTMFASIGSFLSENVLFGGLNLWGTFVAFLDSVAGLVGQPRFFTNLFILIGEMISYMGISITNLGIMIISIFQLFTSLLGAFLIQMAALISTLITTVSFFTDMMGGAYGVGVNVWDDLGISTWITLAMIFYPLYLIILWDDQGIEPVIQQLTWMFGLLWWVFNFFIIIIQFVIGLITTVIESIPVVE